MNLTEFAEQVVFGTTLEEKLTNPGQLADGPDSRSHCNVGALADPGRPIGLTMQHGPGTARPPSDSELENEQGRGRLLHFLANHELLATELMALVLLRFPKAPDEFRRGVLATLHEEQEHTRLYLQRMEECGVEFGSFPLSGHFWRVVEPMQGPIDFVSRLSLTFEQANLDYSLHFATVFQHLGDLDTSRILQRVYHDEIGHVRHGLHWFRQWKDPELSDWQAYQKCLTFPMSPQRARGPKGAFNRAGRLKAGFTDEFINAVEVYRQSRGRTPTVRWFDPGAEAELAGELSFRDRQLMHQLGQDLEHLMVALSKQDDVVIVHRVPSLSFRKQLLDVGFNLPEFILFDAIDTLRRRKLNDLQPWAWTPKNQQIAKLLTPATFHQPANWRADHIDLFRKSWGADRLREWMDECNPDYFTSSNCAGIRVNNVDDIEIGLAVIARHGFSTAIVKQDLATSGRGQRRLRCDEPLTQQDKNWLSSVFGPDVGGVVEPELDRVLDLSFLWHARLGGSPKFLGWTRPVIAVGRRYAGTRLGRFLSNCDEDLTRFLLADGCARLHAVKDWLALRLGPELTKREFSGYFGVDSLVCKDSNGSLRIKPLVELNPRVTMGHVALCLEQRLAPGVCAEFRILSKSEWDNAQENLGEIQLVKSNDGRWKSGVVWLGEADDSTKLIPVVLVGDEAMRVV